MIVNQLAIYLHCLKKASKLNRHKNGCLSCSPRLLAGNTGGEYTAFFQLKKVK